MNQQVSKALGLAAPFTLFLFTMFYEEIKSLLKSDPAKDNAAEVKEIFRKTDKSSLDDDLKDVMCMLPMKQIGSVVQKYAKHDRQVNSAIVYVNERRKVIMREVKKIPHIVFYMFVLRELGLQLNYWHAEIDKYWKSLPENYEENETVVKSDGIRGMMSEILKLIPQNEVHALLCKKNNYSDKFRRFVEVLMIKQFYDMCYSLESNPLVQRHYFKAIVEHSFEVVYAKELMRLLHFYMTTQLM